MAAFAGEMGASASAVPLESAAEAARGCRFIVNASTLGMDGEASPVPEDAIDSNSIIYDVVYRPMATDLVMKGKRRGAEIIYGYEMLIGQACLSFEIWHGAKAPYEAMRRAVLGVWVGGSGRPAPPAGAGP